MTLLLPAAFAIRVPAATQQPPALTAEDKQFLDALMKDFLFDPKGAQRQPIDNKAAGNR